MVRFIVSELSHNSRGMNDDRARAKIIEWIYSSEARRTVLFMSKIQMISYAKEHLPKSARPKSSTHVGPYRDALVKALEGIHSDDSSTDDTSTDDFDVQTATAVLKSAFLKPLKKGEEEGETSYTVKGQRAEKPVLRYFFDKAGKKDFG